MRKLAAVIVLAGLAWGGYWFVGAATLDATLSAWLDARRAEGWQADVADITTRGFPNRFDTTLTGVQLADPGTGVAWTAPFFQILSLSYKPNHVIVALPHEQSLATPNQTITLASAEATGSVVFEPNTRLALNRSQFVISDLDASSTQGWSLKARELRVATRQSTARALSHDIAVEGLGVVPGGDWASIARDRGLPDEIADLKADTTILFSAPWDRLAIEQGRPQPRRIELKTVRAEWGELLFQATGTLDIAEDGVPSGSIALQVRNWREMLNLAVAVGAVPTEIAPRIESGLAMLAGMSGNPLHIDAKLNFRAGFVAVGPIPIGPAPRFMIR